jgi:hypothetical protein
MKRLKFKSWWRKPSFPCPGFIITVEVWGIDLFNLSFFFKTLSLTLFNFEVSYNFSKVG